MLINTKQILIPGTIINVRVVEIIEQDSFIVAYKGHLLRVKNLTKAKLDVNDRVNLFVHHEGHLELNDFISSTSNNVRSLNTRI